ncbi:MAG: ABC transporter substrate-binding protein [Proteobacteria bacterium]|nr:ABC transporter substrate-binding protein [Pseudomonadota bacterium]
MTLRARIVRATGGLFAAVLFACAGSAHAAADMSKTIRDVFPVAETGFDPAAVDDLYSSAIIEAIFDTLYTYDYLRLPARIVPRAAAAMPEISADGKTYTIKLKHGIVFTPDPAFNGKRRELTVNDFIYELKRLADPKIRAPYAFLVQGKIVGLDELAEQAKKTGKFDYDAKIAGLEAVDPYTLVIRLKKADYNLPLVLAHQPTAAVAREVVEKYAESDGRNQAHPVGTGPYLLARWVRSSKIFLDANPDYRGFTWDFTSDDPADAKLIAAMKGKSMPAVGHVEVSIMEEDQSRLLAFRNGELDIMNLEGPLAPDVLDGDKLKPEFQKRGVQLSRIVDPEISYTYWLMDDPVFGGFSKAHIALRRAIAMSYDAAEEIKVVRNGQAISATYPIPPGVIGHVDGWKPLNAYDPALANALLDRFGYKKGADGWRTQPDGKPLVLTLSSRPDSLGRLQDEMWNKALTGIGIRMDVHKDKFPELLKAEKSCKLLSRVSSWIADYPDGDNFMQLMYGPNSGQSNNGCARMPEYDQLYAQTTTMPAGPERDRLYMKMTRIVEVNAAWRLMISRYRNMLVQPRVVGYRKNPFLPSQWQYLDVDAKK